jgi:phage gpG-like protein
MQMIVQTKGMPEFQEAMNAIAERMQNPSPFLKAGGVLMLASVQQNFIEGGRPDKWLPLSQVTYLLRYRDKSRFTTYSSGPDKGKLTKASADNFVSGGAEPLRDKGILMASIVPQEMTEKSISIGTTLPQAGILNDGGTAKGFIKGSPWIPARPFLMLQDADKETLAKMGADYVMRGKA